MTTRDAILAAALQVLEEEGEAAFSTRAVCALAKVGAPTLYHHFGNADGLLSAAMTQAFAQFLARKRAAAHSHDLVAALLEGWDDYVRFAAERPRLYAAMMSRVLAGGEIQAAQDAHALLLDKVNAIASSGRLATSPESAADIAWASANAASLLFVTASLRKSPPPTPAAVKDLQQAAMNAILLPD